jgi:methylated-DNA-[protein]-cysteine S-methyltransferase
VKITIDEIPSPVGTIIVAATDRGVCTLDFTDCRKRMTTLLARRFGETRTTPATDPFGASSAVRAYLEGALDALAAVPLDLGGTPFQMRVWAELRRIPYGETVSYGELAAALGKPSAARAVGAANGRNPVALVVPCHRVVRSRGELGGYAGGLDRKRWLLDHERRWRRAGSETAAAAGC